ncbi:MAG: cation diffusion facilitator family transporter [Candidatus Zhuqueibacterota bacterium]
MEHVIEQLRRGQRVAFWATVATLLLAVLKAAIGLIFNSQLLVADAFHSGADTIAIFASAFGLWLASHGKSERFPYGLYRAETLGTLAVGGLIAWAGIELLFDGYFKLVTVASVGKFPTLPVAASILSMIVAIVIATKEREVGQAIHSRSLIANARESFLDIGTSFVVLAGIVFAYFRIPYIEGATIILISLLILKLGWENLWRSLLILMDANLEKNLQRHIEATARDVYGVRDVYDVKIREAGPFRMVELKFAANPSLTLYKAHELSEEIVKAIKHSFDFIESVFVHIEPSVKNELNAIFPVEEIKGLDSRVHGHFGRAPYYAILRVEGERFEIEEFYLNEFLDRTKHVGLNVVKVIVNYNLDMLFTTQIGEISFYMLKENFIDIYRIEEDSLTIREVISRYLKNQIPRITSPTHTVDEAV